MEAYDHEMVEFAKSARVFKPMSGAMANRFTSAVIIDNGPKVQEGLRMPAPSSSIVPGDAEQGKLEVEESPKQYAARMGMYGPLTREVSEWAPAKLLCKRFGVRVPETTASTTAEDGSTSAPTASQQQQQSFATPLAITSSEPGIPVPAQAQDSKGQTRANTDPKDISNVGLGEDDNQGKDTLTYERPAMDIFKAIFASDDEDSDDDEGDEPGRDAPGIATKTNEREEEKQPEPVDDGPVDLNSFKPKFVPKSHRDGKSKSSDPSSSRSKDRKEKEKKAILSFGMDDDGVEGLNLIVGAADKKAKKKKDREKKRTRTEDEEGTSAKRVKAESGHGEGLEPSGVQPSTTTVPALSNASVDEDEWVEKSPPRQPTHRIARPRASDYL